MTFRSTLLLAAAVSLAGCASRASAGAQTPVHWRVQPATIAANGTGSVTLTAAIDDGWHIYALTQGPGGPVPLRLTLAAGQPVAIVGDVKPSPAPRTEMDDAFGIKVEMHEHQASFTFPVKVTAGAHPDSVRVRVRARYQACNASLCLPPQTAQLVAPVKRGGR